MSPSSLLPSAQYANLPTLDHDEERGDGAPSATSPGLVDRSMNRRSLLGGNPIASSGLGDESDVRPSPYSASSTVSEGSALLLLPNKRRKRKPRWEPWLLRPWAMAVNVLVLVAAAVLFEVVLQINHNAYGWGTPSFYNRFPQIHVLWTAIPGLIIFVLLSQWYEVDRYIKMLEPYVAMSRDRVPAEKSVLLDYYHQSKWLVWTDMIENRHITPFLTNLVVILAVIVPPLCSSYLYLQQPAAGFVQPLDHINVQERLGLYSSLPVESLDAAAGFMLASSIYNVSSPPFIRFLPGAAWSSTKISIGDVTQDGTVSVQTVCLQSFAACELVQNPSLDSSSTTLSGTSANCTFSAPTNGSLPFGMSTATCSGFQAPSTNQNSPLAFWVIDPKTQSPVATVCRPSLGLHKANAHLNSTTHDLLLVDEPEDLQQRDQSGVDLNSAPYNTSAFNGLLFDNVASNATRQLATTQLNFGQALYTLFNIAKLTSPSSNDAQLLQNITTDAYAHYLGLVAPPLYFFELTGVTTSGTLHPTAERLFVSSVVTHILAAILILMAILGTIVGILHRRAARTLHLTSEPSTLASAVALTGQSDLARILDGRDTKEDMRAILEDLNFTLDSDTGRIRVEEGEHGYAEVPSTFQRVNSAPASGSFARLSPHTSLSNRSPGQQRVPRTTGLSPSSGEIPMTRTSTSFGSSRELFPGALSPEDGRTDRS